MDQKPNLEVVVLAVSTLYKNPDRKEKERASQWLLNLQGSVSMMQDNFFIVKCMQSGKYYKDNYFRFLPGQWQMNYCTKNLT